MPKTFGDRNSVPMDHQWEMAYNESNGLRDPRRHELRYGRDGVARAWRRLRLCAVIVSSIVFNSYRFSTLQTPLCSRIIAFDAAYKAAFTLRRPTTSYDVVRPCACTATYTQLVDVKCMVPPAPEHSQTALLKYPWDLALSDVSCCTSLAYSPKSSRRRSTS